MKRAGGETNAGRGRWTRGVVEAGSIDEEFQCRSNLQVNLMTSAGEQIMFHGRPSAAQCHTHSRQSRRLRHTRATTWRRYAREEAEGRGGTSPGVRHSACRTEQMDKSA